MTSPAYENLARWSGGGVSVRIWFVRQGEGPPARQHQKILSRAAADLDLELSGQSDPFEVCNALINAIDGEAPSTINAIEVQTLAGTSLVYPKWP